MSDTGESQAARSQAEPDSLEGTVLMGILTSAEGSHPTQQRSRDRQEIGQEPTQMQLDQGLAGTVIGDHPQGSVQPTLAIGDRRFVGSQADAPCLIGDEERERVLPLVRISAVLPESTGSRRAWGWSQCLPLPGQGGVLAWFQEQGG